jgi:hypothetical protein
MVMVITRCYCNVCPGTKAPKRTAKQIRDNEMVFGGTICHCQCHTLKGKARKEHIKLMEQLYERYK